MTHEFLILLFAKCYFWVFTISVIAFWITENKDEREENKKNAIARGVNAKRLNITPMVLYFMSAYITFFL